MGKELFVVSHSVAMVSRMLHPLHLNNTTPGYFLIQPWQHSRIHEQCTSR